MKKIIAIMILVLSLSLSTVFAFGAIKQPEEISPHYVYVADIEGTYTLNEQGSAMVNLGAFVETAIGIDRAIATVTFVNYHTENEITPWKNTQMSKTEINNDTKFSFYRVHKLTESGTYYVKYEIKFYDGTVLKETATGVLPSKSF